MALNKIQLSQLLATYGQLLTEKQREILAMYCDCDCTLTEIAAEHGISRQGVRDAIVKSESALIKFEDTLHIASLSAQFNAAVQKNSAEEIVSIARKFVGKE